MCGRIPRQWNSLHRQVELGSARGLCGLRDLMEPQELVPVTGADSHEADQLTAPRDKAWLGHVGLGWAGHCICPLHETMLLLSSGTQPWEQLESPPGFKAKGMAESLGLNPGSSKVQICDLSWVF